MITNKVMTESSYHWHCLQEWLAKHPELTGVSFSKKEMKTLRPKKPEQENFSDCGIFLLQYVENMFKT